MLYYTSFQGSTMLTGPGVLQWKKIILEPSVFIPRGGHSRTFQLEGMKKSCSKPPTSIWISECSYSWDRLQLCKHMALSQSIGISPQKMMEIGWISCVFSWVNHHFSWENHGKIHHFSWENQVFLWWFHMGCNGWKASGNDCYSLRTWSHGP